MGAVASFVLGPTPVDDPSLGNHVSSMTCQAVRRKLLVVFVYALRLLLLFLSVVIFSCFCTQDRPYYEYLGMNKFDVAPLLQLYHKMSKDKQGRVKVKTILSYFRIRRSPFMERVFSLLVNYC